MKLLVPGLLGTMRSIFLSSGDDASVEGRTNDYGAIGGLLDGHLFTGRGLGTFLPERYFILDNQYLGTLVETGVIGMVALIVLFLVGIGTADSARRRARNPVDAGLGLALAAAIAGIGVSYTMFDALSFSMAAGMTFLLLGLAGASLRISLDEQRSTVPANAEAGVPA